VTHLPEAEQVLWMAEIRRVLAPGGYLLLSTHGEAVAAGLPPAERVEYQKGNIVILGHQGWGPTTA
jgi:hypothetical protein